MKDLDLGHLSKATLVIQYKLDRIKFCRMHYSLDCLEERLKLICAGPMAHASISEHPGTLGILDESQVRFDNFKSSGLMIANTLKLLPDRDI